MILIAPNIVFDKQRYLLLRCEEVTTMMISGIYFTFMTEIQNSSSIIITTTKRPKNLILLSTGLTEHLHILLVTNI